MGKVTMSSKRFFIRGNYGLDNLGDEVILQSVLEHLDSFGMKAVIASFGKGYVAVYVEKTVIETGCF